jgi:hypothetical protein
MSRNDSWHRNISTGRHFQNGHHNTAQIQHCSISTTTGRNFSMLGINSGHHYLPTYQILMISGNVEFLPSIFYTVFWQPFSKWQTSRIAPLMVTYHYIFKMATTITHKFNIVRLQGHFIWDEVPTMVEIAIFWFEIHITNSLNFMQRKWHTGNQYIVKSAENRWCLFYFYVI